MKLTHKQARRRFEAVLDTAHFYGQKPELDTTLSEHLAECPVCQAYAEQSSSIDAHLAQHMPQTWPVPSIPSHKIDQAILKVHNRVSRKKKTNRHNLWGGMQYAWRGGIGLAGIVLLVGVLYFCMSLLPQNTRGPEVIHPSLTGPIVPSQTAFPTPTAVQVPQGSGRPIAGEWVATTDFGKLLLTVDNTGRKIKKISYQFSEWTCGTGTIINSSEIVDTSGWLITDNKFIVDSTLDREMQFTMNISGTYDTTSQRFSGTWEEASSGSICSGTWEASILTPETNSSTQPPETSLPTATQAP